MGLVEITKFPTAKAPIQEFLFGRPKFSVAFRELAKNEENKAKTRILSLEAVRLGGQACCHLQ